MPGRGRGRPPHPDILTPAEQRVLEELRSGGTNVEIAVRLGISPETVKTHIANMLSKLELADRRQLAAWRPTEKRLRLRALLPLPAALAWTGGAVAVVAVVVALAVMIVVLTGEGDQTSRAILAHESTLSREACLRTILIWDFAYSDGLCLVAVSDASGDSVTLEWTTGAPIAATRWQYRLHRSPPVRVSDHGRVYRGGGFEDLTFGRENLAWEEWTDIPNSDAETRGIRVTGLPAGEAYDFQVRAVTRGRPGDPSAIANVAVTAAPEHPMRLEPGMVVEGDGHAQWFVGQKRFVVTIPKGVRLVAPGAVVLECGAEGMWWPWGSPGPEPSRLDGGHFYWDKGPFSAAAMCQEEYDIFWYNICGRETYLTDLTTGSLLILRERGEEYTRCVVEDDSQRVNAIFDQILASVR